MHRTLGLAAAVTALLLVLASMGRPAPSGGPAVATPAAAATTATPSGAAEPRSPGTPSAAPRAVTVSPVAPPAPARGPSDGDGAMADGAPDPAPTRAPADAPPPEATAGGTPDGTEEAAEDPLAASFLVATVPAAGGVAGTGPRVRYTVEVAPTVAADPEGVAAQVRAALHDPRSWARERTLEQVDDPARARIRVVLADPATVDSLCGRVGLDTAGIYSCWNGRFAALNAWRWDAGAEGFDDLATYRTYLVNHEFGHGIGRGHVGCPSAGALAPVMMQQSKGLDGCRANGWPYPDPAG